MTNNTQTKKSGNPTQPGHRTNASTPENTGKQNSIISQYILLFKRLSWEKRLLLPLVTVGVLVESSWDRFMRFFRRLNELQRVALVLTLIFVVVLICSASTKVGGNSGTPSEPVILTQAEQPHEYIFNNEDGTPVNIQAMAKAWASEAGLEKRYDLTDAERWEVASVVTAEAIGEPFAGKVAVAQCILQACEDDGIRPFEALTKYGYSKHRPEPCTEALEAVQAVFDFGHIASSEPIKYFYAPALVRSDWHESQGYVMTINNHRFFKEAE